MGIMKIQDPYADAAYPTLSEAAALLSTTVDRLTRIAKAGILPRGSILRGRPMRLKPAGLLAADIALQLASDPGSALAPDRARTALAERQRLLQLIVRDKAIQGGAPTFRGTRIQVAIVAGRMRSGDDDAVLAEDYPSLTADHLAAARLLVGSGAAAKPPRARPPARRPALTAE